jgi:hypothetical protein
MDEPLTKRTHYRLPHGKAPSKGIPKVIYTIRFCLFSLLCHRRQDSNRSFAYTCDRVSRYPEPSSLRSCTGRRRIRFFWKRFSRDFSQTTTSSTSWWHLRPGDRSSDFTVYIFVHRHHTTTSTEVLPRLVWLIQRITTHRLPPATAPPWVHSHLVMVLFVHHDQSALSV